MTAPADDPGRPGPLVLDLTGAVAWAPPAEAGAAGDVAALDLGEAPVPAGYAITVAACDAFSAQGDAPEGFWDQVAEATARLEWRCGLSLGDRAHPLLLAVLSAQGAVVGIGLNGETLSGLEERGEGAFGAAAYARLQGSYLQALAEAAGPAEAGPGHGGDAPTLDASAATVPPDPVTQLHRAIEALAQRHHRAEGSPRRAAATDATVALTVVQLVSGDRGARSGSGVAYSRDPVTGTRVLTGLYLPGGTHEQLRTGSRPPLPLSRLADDEPEIRAELARHVQWLEDHHRDAVEVEFVVEEGRLWLTRGAVLGRSPEAAFRISGDLTEEGTIDLDEALRRVDGHQLHALLRPVFRPGARHAVVTRGAPASPGSAIGLLALEAATARLWAAQGLASILAVDEVTPASVAAVADCRAVITTDRTSPGLIADRARRLAIPCVTGIEAAHVLTGTRRLTLPSGLPIQEGSEISVDGTTGLICAGRCQTQPSELSRALQEPPLSTEATVATRWALRLLDHADRRRRLEVHANADTPEEARIARRLGAQGIGLCRSEHLLIGHRRELLERLLSDEDRAGALASIESFTLTELLGILEAMDGLPVVLRLLDPPLQELLPDVADLAVTAALAEERGAADEEAERRLMAVRRWRGTNPRLGLRGVRILTLLPWIVDIQVRALARATVELRSRGLHPRPLLMIPLVAEVAELDIARRRIERVVAQVCSDLGTELDIPVGVMVELPRAALTAASLARSAAFFSFGTNDLTETVWGMSRDDAAATFLKAYRDAGILRTDPFVRLDETGVGRLVRLAAEEGRRSRPDLGLGVCGNHSDDPDSVPFLAEAGLDYLSCSVLRVPVIRLEAGRQAVLGQPANPSFQERRNTP